MKRKKFYFKEKEYSDPFEEFKDKFKRHFYIDRHQTEEECYKYPYVTFEINHIEDSERKKFYQNLVAKEELTQNKFYFVNQKYIKKFGPLTNEPIYRNLKRNEILKKITLLNERKKYLQQSIPNGENIDFLINDLFQKKLKARSISKEIETLRASENSYLIKKGWIFSSRELKSEIEDKINILNQTAQLLFNKLNSNEFDNIKNVLGELDFIEKIFDEYNKRLNQFLRQDKSEASKKDREQKKFLIEQKKIEAYRLKEEKRKENEQKKEAELNKVKNKLQEKEKDKRKTLKKLKPSLKHFGYCPYCFESFSKNLVTHVDHIYPLSKGGLESIENLVVVCSECNLNKGNLTLNNFIKKFNLNREAIEKELDLLNKEY